MDQLELIQSKIYDIRGQRVMLDRDLAELYRVTTGNLNKAVKRNIKRFPPDFMFQLTSGEFDELKAKLIFQNGISSWGGTRKLPYAFTEQNDINEDTRLQLELINRTLAELQVQKKLCERPRRPVGFIRPEENE